MKRQTLLTVLVAVTMVSVCMAVRAQETLQVVARDPDGQGLLAKVNGKRVLFVSGTPEQMGRAHGRLLAELVPNVMPRTMALVGAGLAVKKGEWFYDRIEEIYRRAGPHTPERFLRECRAMAAAASITERAALSGNFFPELFHCSGVAVRNTASTDGRVIHARVLDYMRDIHLQNYTVLQVFQPADGIPWMSVGYAGFLGTVTAMNLKGVAIGEMGGKGEGDWDGMPMTFLMREVAERAENVEQALAIVVGVGALPDDLDGDLKVRAEEHLIELAADHDPKALKRLARTILEVVAPDLADAHLAKQLEKLERDAEEANRFRIWETPQGLSLIHISEPTRPY